MTDLLGALATLRTATWTDLTHAFRPGIPHYAGFADEQRERLEEFGFVVHRYAHVGQWGTHVDPPSHSAPEGRALDALPVTEMLLELVVLEARAAAEADPDYVADVALVEAHEAEHGPIPQGAFVALRTGWSRRWPDADAMRNPDADGVAHYPGWSVAALRFLVEQRGVAAIGHEQTDTDPGTELSAGRADAEHYLLRADRWQVEMLADLDGLPPRGALILATWAKPEGGSGFPARCVAIS